MLKQLEGLGSGNSTRTDMAARRGGKFGSGEGGAWRLISLLTVSKEKHFNCGGELRRRGESRGNG